MALLVFFALFGAALGAAIKLCPTVAMAPVFPSYRYKLVGVKDSQFRGSR